MIAKRKKKEPNDMLIHLFHLLGSSVCLMNNFLLIRFCLAVSGTLETG